MSTYLYKPIAKRGRMTFMKFISIENEQQATDVVIFEISERLIAKNQQAYKELTK